MSFASRISSTGIKQSNNNGSNNGSNNGLNNLSNIQNTLPIIDNGFKILCIDESGSMGENASNSEEAKGYTRRDFACQGAMLCVKSFPIGTKVCIIAFDDRARVVCDPIVITPDNAQTICNKIMEIVPRGGTNIKTSLTLAKTVMEQQQCINAHVILITDGEDDGLKNGIDLETKFRDLRTFGEFNFKIDTIGLGPNADTKLLVKIADLCRGVYTLCISAFEVGTVFGRAAARAILHNNDIFCISEVNEPNTGGVYAETKQKFIYFKDKLSGILLDTYSPFNLEKQVQKLSQYDNEISDWLQQNQVTHNISGFFQFIIDIRSDVQDQIYLAISSDNYWKTWGVSYWTTTGIALKKCYSPNSKDLCLSHFGSEKAKAKYQEISDLYESMPLIEKSGYCSNNNMYGGFNGLAQAVPLTTAHFNDRDAGCFHPLSTFETLEGEIVDFEFILSNIKENKEVWLKGQNNVPVKVETIIKTPIKGRFTEFCKVNNTILTPTHPILDSSDMVWKHPKKITNIFIEQVSFVFNLVLAINPDSGSRFQSVLVNGNVCVCLGHGILDGSVAEDSFWGSEHVIEEYKTLYPDEYKKGFIENPDHKMIRDSRTDNVIGFRMI